MEDLNVEQKKATEEFYIGIQIFALLILSIITKVIITKENQLPMKFLTGLYCLYLSIRLYILIKHKNFFQLKLEYTPPIYTSIIDGLFIAFFTYINSSQIYILNNMLYVFVILQSIRYNANKTYIFSTYASLIHIALVILIKGISFISLHLFISISLYYIFNFLICSSLKQINYLEIQRQYFQNELIKKNEILQEIAYKDYLTNMNNHQSFYVYFDSLIQSSNKHNNSISLILIDIDDFKQVNDTYGHLAGDKLLRELSNILKDNIRKSDFSARYGGEEFAILLPNTDLHLSTKIAERIRQAVEQNNFIIDDKIIKATISLGVGSYTSLCLNQQYHFIDEVDKLLYEAKNSGKNIVKSKVLCNIVNEDNSCVINKCNIKL